MPRHGSRGFVEAPKQADSQRVDFTRQDVGGNTPRAPSSVLLASLQGLVGLPRHLVGQRRKVEGGAVPIRRMVYLVPEYYLADVDVAVVTPRFGDAPHHEN